MDSTSSMNDIFDFFIRVFTWIFEFLDSIQFWGISLLDFIITLFIIAIALPIILAIVKSRSVVSNASRAGHNVRSRFNRGDE